MAFFIVPRRFAREVPSETARFLRDHELLGNATHVMSHRHRANLIDGSVPTWNGSNRPLAVWQGGVSPGFSQNRYYSIPAGATDTTTPWTYAFIVGFTGTVNPSSIASHSDVALTTPMDRAVLFDAGAGMRSMIYSGTARYFTSANTGTYGYRAYVATMTTSAWRWYWNGREYAGSNTYSTTGGAMASTSVLNIAKGYANITSYGLTGMMPLFIRAYGRAWTPSEAMQFCQDPWQMFEQTPEVLYFIPASSQTLSLDAQDDAFTITGAAATLNVARNLDAQDDAFAVTGAAATLVVGHALDAQPAAVAVAGADLTVSGALSATLEPGAVAVAGADAGTARALLASADPTAYVAIGADASLPVALALDAQAGSAALSGADLGAARALAVTTDPAAVAIAGADAALPLGRAVDAQPGAVAVAGVDATLALAATTSINGEPGAVAVAGADAGFTVAESLDAGAGAVAVSGADATFAVAVTLTAEAGALAVTGASAELALSGAVQELSLDAEAGALTVAGAALTSTSTRSCGTLAGALAVAGSPAAFALARNFTAEAGALTVAGAALTGGVSRVLSADVAALALTGAPLAVTALWQAALDAASFNTTGVAAELRWEGDVSLLPVDPWFTVASTQGLCEIVTTGRDFTVA